MEFLGLNPYAWFTIATVVTMFGLLLRTKLPADIVFLGGMGALLLSGTLSPKDALSGFSSESVVVIGVLFVVVAGLSHTGVMQWIVRHLLGNPSSYAKAIVRLMLPVAALSSVLSNTTVVAMFINVVKIWSKKLGIAPSRLLIPLSYASGMGGVCTLIGTPPNLIVSGFYMEETGETLSIFTTTLAGVFCLAVGIISILAMQKLLPVRESPEDSFSSISDYTVELLVPTDCTVVGSTIEESNLDNVNGGHLIEIVRFDKEVISPVDRDEFILGGDRLIYSGEIESILELRKSHGLVSASEHVFSASEISKKRKLQTAFITFSSSLIGKSMMEAGLEQQYNMVLVAVARHGKRITESPREIVLQAGDTLLLEGENILPENFRGNLQFFDSEDIPQIGGKTVVSSLIMLSMILLSAFDVIPLLNSCFLAAFAMLITRCCSVEQAQRSIDWNVLMVFAGSVCLGMAIEKTGIAQQMADGLLNVCGTNPYVVMGAICLVATFITEFISNTACAAMFYPIAFKSAVALGANPLAFCVALMIAASSSFATPIGSPTHMMVYGPGGYRFSDFIKIGLPMNFIILAANLFIVSVLFPL